jgi:hypothetical protein
MRPKIMLVEPNLFFMGPTCKSTSTIYVFYFDFYFLKAARGSSPLGLNVALSLDIVVVEYNNIHCKEVTFQTRDRTT